MPALPSLIVGLLLAGSPATAAEVTDLPQPLRGAVALSYDSTGDVLSIEEGGVEVGRRRHRDHTMQLDLEFSPVRAVSLVLQLPVVMTERVNWTSANQMVFDPNLQTGSLAAADPMQPLPLLKGGGLAGPTIMLRAAPFHEQLYTGHADRTSWVLEAGYRFRDKSSFFRVDQAGKRGGGEGAAALHLRSAWSTTRRTNRPYVEATFDKPFTVPTPLRAEDGTVLTAGAAVRPATRFTARVGTEVPAYDRDDTQVFVDLRSHVGYRSWQDLPSGTYLPDVLEASRAVLVTQGDALWITGGLGVALRLDDRVDVRVGGDFGTETPYTVEHPYDVTTAGGAMLWSVDAQVKVWLSDRLLGLDADAVGGL